MVQDDWVRNLVRWELRKKVKFDYTAEWYVHKPESVFEWGAKIFRDFKLRTHYLIPARRSDLVIINKKKKKKKKKKRRTWRIADFGVPADHRVNIKETETRDKYFDLARELIKLWNMRMTVIPVIIGVLGRFWKEAGRIGNRTTNQGNPNCSIVKNGRNTEKSPGDRRKLAITHTPVKDH